MQDYRTMLDRALAEEIIRFADMFAAMSPAQDCGSCASYPPAQPPGTTVSDVGSELGSPPSTL